jgi:hypothetical protein
MNRRRSHQLTNPHQQYSLFNDYSGQIVYESWTWSFYNVLFTVLPPLVIGIFDQFVSARMLDRYPQLYKLGQSNAFFTKSAFWQWIGNAFYHSIVSLLEVLSEKVLADTISLYSSCSFSQSCLSAEVSSRVTGKIQAIGSGAQHYTSWYYSPSWERPLWCQSEHALFRFPVLLSTNPND